MIIGEDFVWLHFPKCAGTFTEKLLKQVVPVGQLIEFDPIDPNNIIWHQNVPQREKMTKVDLSSKNIICNFRRLPGWIISRIIYEKERSGYVATKELYSVGNFLNENGVQRNADSIVRRYTTRRINHWIRTENIEEDFIRVFSKYIKFTPSLDSSDFQRRVNSSDWGNDIHHWFSGEDLIKLYNSCPVWSEFEREVYGNLLIDNYR